MRQESGFITLVSTVIITALLLVLVMSLSASAFMQLSDSSIRSSLSEARTAAVSCGEVVLLRLQAIPEYQGREEIIVNSKSCLVNNMVRENTNYFYWTVMVQNGQAVSVAEFTADRVSLNILSQRFLPFASSENAQYTPIN